MDVPVKYKMMLTSASLLVGSTAAAIEIDQKPLLGVAAKYGANVMLAPSIEYPTAGPAYSTVLSSYDERSNYYTYTRLFQGYFDPDICYKYDRATRYFVPDGAAHKFDYKGTTLYGGCNIPKYKGQYSGSFLNLYTMSAIDILRKILTGGNRVIDNKNKTVLQRANIVADANTQWNLYNQWGGKSTRTSQGNWYTQFNGFTGTLPKDVLEKFLPIDEHPLFPPYGIELRFPAKTISFAVCNLKEGVSIALQNGSNPPQCPSGVYPRDYERVAIQVCEGDDPANKKSCMRYPSGYYKPVGIFQRPQYSKMRFGLASYLKIDGDQRKSAVRAPMRFLAKGKHGGGKPEIDAQTGQFEDNPDRVSGVNSGVINTLNKFGYETGYIMYDPAAEMLYVAMRYLRYGGHKEDGTPNGKSIFNISPSSDQLDGFFADYNWDDPLTSDFGNSETDQKQKMCRSNAIILFGDTNTWYEQHLPDYPGSSVTDDDIPTASLIEDIMHKEDPQNTRLPRGSWGMGGSTLGQAALALWGNTKDNRPDIPGLQKIKSYFIDTVEQPERNDLGYKVGGNAFYLAGKYGTFKDSNDNDWPDQRDEWTTDPAGQSSIPEFSDGVPIGYSTASDPEKMAASFERIFTDIDSTKTDLSQSAISPSSQPGAVVDLADNPLFLAPSFNANEWSGDVIAHEFKTGGGLGKEVWSAAAKLDKAYFGNAYNTRNVFTKGRKFTSANAQALVDNAADPAALVDYVLGKRVVGEIPFRRRASLMGTIVNSTTAPILPTTKAQSGLACDFSDAAKVKSREKYFAFAANDGMLHMVNAQGEEKAAYIPSTVLPQLKDYANPDYAHLYLNDATPVVQNVCLDGTAGTATTLLVGATGRGAAKTLYALDVTDPANMDQSKVKWEYHDDAYFGQTTSAPELVIDGAGKVVVVSSSGYNNSDGKGYILIVNAKDGSLHQKIELGTSGVGSAFVLKAADGKAKHIFAGDTAGKLWQLNFDDANGKWVKAYGGKPLFAPSGDKAKPIYAAPIARYIGGRLFVSFGTGQYLHPNDINSTSQNYAYGMFVDDKPIEESDFLDQEIQTKGKEGLSEEPPRTLYQITDNKAKKGETAWRIKLLPGQQITDRPNIIQNKLVQFTAIRKDESAITCGVSGSTAIILVGIKNGGQYKLSVFDTNLDGQVNKEDKEGGMLEVNGRLNPSSAYFPTTNKNVDENYVVVAGVWVKVRSFSDNRKLIRLNFRKVGI